MNFRRYIALVPHRDVSMSVYRHSLFEGGCAGAFSLPVFLPLAKLKAPLRRETLCTLSRLVREETAEKGLSFDSPAVLVFDGIRFWGLHCAANFEESTALLRKEGAAELAEKPVLAICVLRPDDKAPAVLPQPLCFRAAFLANMTVAELPAGEQGYSFCWKLGRAAWLPKMPAVSISGNA